MKVGDFLIGLMLLGAAIAVVLYAQTLPNPARQAYGPGFFPGLIGFLLAIASIILIWNGWKTERGLMGVDLAPWMRDPVRIFRFLLVPASVVFYIYFVSSLGFIPTTSAILLAMLLSLGVAPLTAIANAVAIPLVVHTAFYMGLGVQLPWGLLAPIRW